MSLQNQAKDVIIDIFAPYDWIFFLANKFAWLGLAAAELPCYPVIWDFFDFWLRFTHVGW